MPKADFVNLTEAAERLGKSIRTIALYIKNPAVESQIVQVPRKRGGYIRKRLVNLESLIRAIMQDRGGQTHSAILDPSTTLQSGVLINPPCNVEPEYKNRLCRVDRESSGTQQNTTAPAHNPTSQLCRVGETLQMLQTTPLEADNPRVTSEPTLQPIDALSKPKNTLINNPNFSPNSLAGRTRHEGTVDGE